MTLSLTATFLPFSTPDEAPLIDVLTYQALREFCEASGKYPGVRGYFTAGRLSGMASTMLYASILGLINPNIDAYNMVDAMPDNLPAVKYPRTPGYFPDASQNSRNAWYVRTSIKGASSGVLKGKKVAVKDNVMVAGVPMMNGNSILEGYVPDIDATVVVRLLDAGAEIIGKTH